MKNYVLFTGIDVSKDKLDICYVDKNGNVLGSKVIDYKPKNIKSIVKDLERLGYNLTQTLICFENTGVYSIKLGEVLSELNAYYSEVSALEINKSKGITRGKDDKTDAKMIALYALRNIDKIVLSKVTDEAIQELKLLFAEREKIQKSITSLKMTQENEGRVNSKAYESVQKINQQTRAALKNSLKAIENEIERVFKEHPELKKNRDLLKSIKGIGTIISAYLVMITHNFTKFKNSRKFACYSGIAPFEHSSGKSVRGKTQVNHFANKKVKALLSMAVQSAKKYNSQIKVYFEKKKEQGKHILLISNNIKFKLVNIAFAVIKRGTPYVDIYKYATVA